MYELINGWTKERMVARLTEVFEGKTKCGVGKTCFYRKDRAHDTVVLSENAAFACAAGAFISDEESDQLWHAGRDSDWWGETHQDIAMSAPLATDGMRAMQSVHDASGGLVLEPLLDFVAEHVREAV